jgi:hypothetical protein
MTKIQAKQLALTALKVSAAILLFTAKAFLYTCLALYTVGELLFSEYQSAAIVEQTAAVTGGEVYASMPWLEKESGADVWEEVEPMEDISRSETIAPAKSCSKTIDRPAVLSVEVSDAMKETIARSFDKVRYQSMTTPQLRKECSTVGIKWRNACGTNKHLSKTEMLVALCA